MSWWWLAMPVLALPVWWHRQRREQARGGTLATARFATPAVPAQLRAWRWQDKTLLALRCALLLVLIAYLAAPVIGWRGDTVLIVPGADPAWIEQTVGASGMGHAARLALPDTHALEWWSGHEDAWRRGARIVVIGDVFMPAQQPVLAHRVELRTTPAGRSAPARHVVIHSAQPAAWLAFFRAASTGSVHYVVDQQPAAGTALVVWDDASPPPAGMRAPLWWATVPAAFPELSGAARRADIVRAITDTPHGRVWLLDRGTAGQPGSASALFEAWQELHYPAAPYTAPSQVLDGHSPQAPAGPDDGGGADARRLFGITLLALLAAERLLAHVRRA